MPSLPRLCSAGFIAAAALIVCAFGAPPSAPVPETSQWTFRFGDGPGMVNPKTMYTPERGYGWAVNESGNGTLFSGSRRNSPMAVGSDGSPFAFEVKVPEGNYRVTVAMADHGNSGTSPCFATIKAEARRLLAEKIVPASGQTETRTFTVNVRRDTLKDGGKVHLKKDEIGGRDWDDRLTLEFLGNAPFVSSLTIEKVDVPTVFISGDSTVCDQGREPWAAWGQILPCFFGPDVAIANHAESGESLKGFQHEKRLQKIAETIKPGDFLFIQFTHNDQKAGSAHVEPFTTYQEELMRQANLAREHGATPVFVTSMHRRRFDANGKVVNTLAEYPDAMRQLARREKIPLIDLNAASKTLYEALGPTGTLKAFVHYPAHTFPGQETEFKDDTHFNAYGAYELAKCVVEGIKANLPVLAAHLTPNLPTFDPAHPNDPNVWSLPRSPAVPTSGAGVKPDGS